ncbi:uncharacterized protein LOC129717461 isoform X2 [Wyeomyia smithii]|uniref:uncharacterized protein LOC129717461 isoform X2 n=1 Tax=Wyeomyia smithii TaxID=174621 RepID=UPI002467D266|nr:uncharacterized protein LOC129717461 isoform X2 [Wyeomyia smithii]
MTDRDEARSSSGRYEVCDEVEISTTDLLPPRMDENPENKSESSNDKPSLASVSIDKHAVRLIEECGVQIQCLDIVGIFRDYSSGEYIKKKFPMKKKIDQLTFSARLCHADFNFKLHNEGCLMTADDNFVAKVRIDNPQPITQAVDFDEAKTNLLQQLRISKVLQDDLTTEREAVQSSIVEKIQNVLQQTFEGANSAENIQLCYLISQHSDSLDFRQLCEAINANRLIRAELRSMASSFLELETRGNVRDKNLAQFDHQSTTPRAEIIAQLQQILDRNLSSHREQLLKIAPICLENFLSNCSSDRMIFVHKNDVALFSDLTKDLSENIFQKPLADLAVRWTNCVEKLTVSKQLPVNGLISTSFYLLAKSLQELVVEISGRTDHKAEDLLTSDSCGWHAIEKITWKSEDLITKCLEQEYFIIIKLLKHFDLNCDSEKRRFKNTAEFFQERKHHSTWKQLVRLSKPISSEGNSLNIVDEKYIWHYLLGDVLYHSLPAEQECSCFEAIFESYMDFMFEAGPDQMEMLRVITHSIARFIVQTMNFLVQKDCSTIDHQILQKQLNIINLEFIQSSFTPSYFRGLVNAFNLYWKHRDNIIAAIPSKICLPEMESLKKILLDIVFDALSKSISIEILQCFFKSYCELLRDLNKVEFVWYIKAFPGVSMKTFEDFKTIELVDNEWTQTEHKSYRVIAVEKFIKTASLFLESSSLPKHYVIEYLLRMVSYIKNQLTKDQWKSGSKLSETEQICTTKELLEALRKSFLNLKEQADYKSFQLFLDERIKPFENAVDNSYSHADFTNRIRQIENQYTRFIRKQNHMKIDEALKLFEELNSASEIEVLRSAYQIYKETFYQFLVDSHNEYIKEASRAANKVLEMKFQKSFETWNNNDKREKIPKLLAGLAVVWSILESKDVSTTGKFLTPRCTQILCILRLLSVDQATEGVLNHLAQVLSGQGKSLVLALTAALLALTGHDPRIACGNEFLVSRNEQNFQQFFSMFNVENSIVYGTIRTIADDVVDRTELGNLFTRMLLAKKEQIRKNSFFKDMRNIVLLIDEVNLFGDPSYYVEVVSMLPGLDLIQEKIWEIVSSQKGNSTVDNVLRAIYSFIDSKEMIKEKEFHAFIANDTQFDLLTNYLSLQFVNYTNKKLFNQQLKAMVEYAIQVYKKPMVDLFELSPKGTILVKYENKYINEKYLQYYNIFNYFHQCKINYKTKVENEVNYGYFLLPAGSISRAVLLRKYSLILGVSSIMSPTKEIVEDHFNINQTSIIPAHSGVSKLRFHPSRDFRVLADDSQWWAEIFNRVQTVIAENRSVLVCYTNYVLLDFFQKKYFGKLSNFNVLIGDTEWELRNRYINEVGVAGTITLTTRDMVRGIDFKSSDEVEKNGGLHVIQTFFSCDPHEEVLIYELIVCRMHLDYNSLNSNDVTYTSLDALRQDFDSKQHKVFSKFSVDARVDHETTINYLNAL